MFNIDAYKCDNARWACQPRVDAFVCMDITSGNIDCVSIVFSHFTRVFYKENKTLFYNNKKQEILCIQIRNSDYVWVF